MTSLAFCRPGVCQCRAVRPLSALSHGRLFSSSTTSPGSSDASLSKQDAHAIKGKTLSSTSWLRRQLSDPYVRLAKIHELRSRSAFKLKEMDNRLKLLNPGMRVIDLGCSPGGWSLVAANRVRARASPGEEPQSESSPPASASVSGQSATEPQKTYTEPATGNNNPRLYRSLINRRLPAHGSVIGVDLLPMEPIPGVSFFQGDFLEAAIQQRVKFALRGYEADMVMSDMAPDTCGSAVTDHLRIMTLAHAALTFAEGILRPGGHLLVKIFMGAEQELLESRLDENFLSVKHHKPAASRRDSREVYLHATGFVPSYLHTDASETDPDQKEEMRQRLEDIRQSVHL